MIYKYYQMIIIRTIKRIYTNYCGVHDVSILLTRKLLTIHKVMSHDDKMLNPIASCHIGFKPALSLDFDDTRNKSNKKIR